MTKTRSLTASILISIAGVVAYIIGRNLSVPGIDTHALDHLMANAGGTAIAFGPSPASVLGVGLKWLLILWLVESFVPAAHSRWSAGTYLALSTLTALGQTFWLQSLTGWAEVIPEPGLQFIVVATATQAAGAAFLLFLSRSIGWRGFGHGVLVLLGVELLGHTTGALVVIAKHMELEILVPAVALFEVLLGMAPLVLGLALLSFRRFTWPECILGGLRFVGAIDVLVVPYVVMAGLAWGVALMPMYGLPLDLPQSLPGLAALVVAIVLLVVLGGRGDKAVRPGYLAVAIATPIVGLAILAVTFVVVAGPSPAMFQPGPFAGDGCFVVTLATDASTPDADRDSDDRRAMMTRIEAAGVDPRLTATPPGKMEIELRDIAAPGDLLAFILPPRRLSFRMMAKDQTPLQPRAEEPLVDLEVERDYDTGAPYFVAPSREALAPLLARLDRPDDALIECRQSHDGSEKCSAWLLDAPVLTAADVESAEVTLNPDMGLPEVALRFDDRGRQRFGEVTAANVGNKLAIVVDDQINSMPKIMEAITGGAARITLGRSHAEDTMQEARAMVAALTTGRLEQTWSVSSIASCTR